MGKKKSRIISRPLHQNDPPTQNYIQRCKLNTLLNNDYTIFNYALFAQHGWVTTGAERHSSWWINPIFYPTSRGTSSGIFFQQLSRIRQNCWKKWYIFQRCYVRASLHALGNTVATLGCPNEQLVLFTLLIMNRGGERKLPAGGRVSDL